MDDVAELMHDKAQRVLLAAIAEADGKAGEYVDADRVIERANSLGADIRDQEEFRAIAQYLVQQGFLAEGGAEWREFVVSSAGVDEADRYR
jgi:hypothetical protein